MARLLSWPRGLGTTSREPLSGPRAVGASSSESATGWVQTTASPYGLWRWAFSLPPLRGVAARRWRGLVTALHGGANAVRVPLVDPDGLTGAEAGLSFASDPVSGDPWDGGQPWSSGRGWRVGRPLVAVAADAAIGATEVSLDDAFWGAALGYGDMFGFTSVFGWHVVTRVVAPGTYRIWPPLRAPIDAETRATLEPVMAMRLEGETSANLPRGISHAEGLTITLVEVEHRDVVDWFQD